MANTSGNKGGKKPASNYKKSTTSTKKPTSSSKGKGAQKAVLDKKTLVTIVVVCLLVIAVLVYLIGFNGLEQITKGIDLNKQSGTSNNSNGSGSGSSGSGSGSGSGSSANLSGTSIDGDYLAVHFIDIGQGDAIVMMLPDGKIFVLDAGSTTTGLAAIRTEYLAYLSDTLHVDEVDYLLITHPDADHFNMAGNVLDAYVVKNVIYNNSKEKTQYTNFLNNKVEKEEGASLYPVNADPFTMQITGNGEEADYTIDIYAPGDTGFSGAQSKWNSMSIMCVLSYGGTKVMFTGDGEVETEEWFMETVGGSSLDVDVLKVGHHGSRSCTSTAFVQFIDPEYAVISCDDGTEYGHPHQETMTTLNNYGVVTYRTNRNGNIVLYMDDDGDFGFVLEKDAAAENNSQGLDGRVITLTPAA